MDAYYNDHDPKATAWLGELVRQGHIARGEVDHRSITEICGLGLGKYAQCHFFAGIGGWSYALRLAGWPDERPVWTGSCPCQPFSSAGKRRAEADERHMWPEFRRLIAECRPPTIFGEQVASKLGREWLAGVRADLEQLGYAVGAADLPAACVGAPHIRQRLFWVGHSPSVRRHAGRNDDNAPERREGPIGIAGTTTGGAGTGAHVGFEGSGCSFWSDAEWLPCLDGKERRTQPGLFPMAYGVPARVGRLRGYGNAIVPQATAAFIRATMDP